MPPVPNHIYLLYFDREKKWQATQTSHYAPSDYESAMKKLSDVAMRFDPVNKASSVISSKDFSAHLTAYEVKKATIWTIFRLSNCPLANVLQQYRVRKSGSLVYKAGN